MNNILTLMSVYLDLGLLETADLVDIINTGMAAYKVLWVNNDGTRNDKNI